VRLFLPEEARDRLFSTWLFLEGKGTGSVDTVRVMGTIDFSSPINALFGGGLYFICD
jgi:hypothetical protein